MSRKKISHKKRSQNLEPKYKNPLLSKFMRMLMWDGKLSVAEKNVYEALARLEEKSEDQSGLELFLKALSNIKPLVRVKARRVGGSTYQVPLEVPEELGWTLAMRWVIEASRKKKGASISQKLFAELSDALDNRGTAVKKKEDTHRMAEANRAYAHFRV